MDNYSVNPRSFIHTIPMLRYSILFVLGIILSDFLNGAGGVSWGVPAWILASCLVAACAVLLPKVNAMAGDIATLILIIMLGGLRLSIREDGLAVMSDKARECMDVVVVSEPVQKERVIQFDGIIGTNNDAKWKKYVGKKVKCSMLKDTTSLIYKKVHIGTVVTGLLSLSTLSEMSNSNARFDYARWLRMHDFVARGFTDANKCTIREASFRDLDLWEYLKMRMLKCREWILTEMRNVGMQESSFAVASAMVLGDKSALTPDLRREYSASGVSHILALSGMHLSIIYAIFSFVLGRKSRRTRLCVLGAIWGYVLLVGMPVSVIRAAVVLTLWEAVSMMWYDQHPLNIFGLALMLITAANPHSVWDVGFQLSFSAVLAIMLFAEPINAKMPEAWRQRNKKEKRLMKKRTILKYWVLRGLWYIGGVSIAAQLGTAPLVLSHFGMISGLFGLTNFIAVPLSSIIICLTLLLVSLIVINAAISGLLWSVVWLVGVILSNVICFQNLILGWMSSIPFASIDNVHVNAKQVVVIYAVIIGTGIILKKDKKH